MAETHIVLHHSLTKDGKTVSAAAIEKYHREVNGWRDVGYHGMLERITDDPNLEEYAYQGIVGRPLRAQAAAVKEAEMNRLGLHLCFIGNYDLAPPPLAMLERAVLRFIIPWMDDFGVLPDRIVGHRDFAPYKSCPGTQFDLEVVRRMVR